MAWRGSISRSLMSAARASAFRSPAPAGAARISRPASSGLRPGRLNFSNPRTLGELGCAQSLMPVHSMLVGAVLTSHLSVNVRAYCELSHGTFCRSCQDR